MCLQKHHMHEKIYMEVCENQIAIKHEPSGLFSECSVRLHFIIEYFNIYKALPKQICSKQQFGFYKDSPEIDVAKILFVEREDIRIDFKDHTSFNAHDQYSDYRRLPFRELRPFLEKYFDVGPEVRQRERDLTHQYNITFGNTTGVIYRGNDKSTETRLAPYELFFRKADQVAKRFPDMRFLIQTDELEFRDEFCARFSNSFYFEGLPPIPRNPNNVIRPPIDNRIGFGIELLAAVRCLGKAEHLITGSGNLNLWTVLFRGHGRNIHQFVSGM